MIASARAAHVGRGAARLGVHADSVRVDWPAIVTRKDRIVEQWRGGVARRLERTGASLSVVCGHARFVGPRQIDVDGKRFSAGQIVVNVGGRPVEPTSPACIRSTGSTMNASTTSAE